MLFVKTEELLAFGEYLVKTQTELDSLLTDLDSKMSTITTGWNDSEGTEYVAKFKTFIVEAKKISVEVNNLGTYAKNISSNYDQILSESLGKMGD